MFNKILIITSYIFFLSTIILAQDPCEDFIIENLPYTHVFNNTDQGNDWTNEDVNGNNIIPDSSDVAYKLVLTEERTLFIDNRSI